MDNADTAESPYAGPGRSGTHDQQMPDQRYIDWAERRCGQVALHIGRARSVLVQVESDLLESLLGHEIVRKSTVLDIAIGQTSVGLKTARILKKSQIRTVGALLDKLASDADSIIEISQVDYRVLCELLASILSYATPK